MAIKRRYGSAGILILTLAIATDAIGQDANAGRELFEREWEFVERAPTFTELDSVPPIRQLKDRGRGRGMGRGPHPRHRGNGRELTSIRVADGTRVPVDGLNFPGDGLGPLHNAISCAACHPGGGSSGVNHNVTLITVDPRSPSLSQPTDRGRRGGRGRPRNSDTDFFPGLMSDNTLSFNTIVHDLSTRPGYDAIRQRLSAGVPGGLPAEWFSPQERTVDAIAQQAVVAGRYALLEYYLSQRNSTPLYGMGVIERVSIKRLQAISINQPRASGGTISGRVAGKYGWRGQVSTLSDFVVGACATELGLNVAGAAQQANDPADPRYRSLASDISTKQIADLTSFVADLPAPSKRVLPKEERKLVRRGERVFITVGCAACHIADLQPARGIFSDLLLHDMGAELQDPFPAPMYQRISARSTASASAYQNRYGRSESSSYRAGSPTSRRRSSPNEPDPISLVALQREWKTPPLWGVADSAPYLHDGRAETLTDAIQWHGGEADVSKQKFLKLNDDQKELLLAFLGSLKAPLQRDIFPNDVRSEI